jgi:hypothetical protein
MAQTANGAAGNEDVVLKLDYQWVNINAAFNTTTNSSDTQTFRVGAADNYTGSIYLVFVDTHVIRDGIGSIQEVVK